MSKTAPNIEDIIKEIKKFSPPVKLETSALGTTSNTEKIKNQFPVSPNTTKTERGTGTLGETGSMFEPKDIIALLHKGERVLNPKENTDLTNLYEMMSNLKAKGDTEKDKGVPEIETTTASVEPEEAQADSITLKDVHESLERLNSTMQIMAEHTADMKDSNRTTADMSQKMTGNRLAV
jgi:hypothetical protein